MSRINLQRLLKIWLLLETFCKCSFGFEKDVIRVSSWEELRQEVYRRNDSRRTDFLLQGSTFLYEYPVFVVGTGPVRFIGDSTQKTILRPTNYAFLEPFILVPGANASFRHLHIQNGTFVSANKGYIDEIYECHVSGFEGLRPIIYVQNSIIGHISSSSFTQNKAEGIFLFFNSLVETLSDIIVSDNLNQGSKDLGYGFGGALRVKNSTITSIRRSKFERNSAPFGAAIIAWEGSHIKTIGDGCEFNQNVAENGQIGSGGGAITLFIASIDSLEDCIFQGNSAPTGAGGAIRMFGSSIKVLKGNRFIANSAVVAEDPQYGSGGALFSLGSSIASIMFNRFEQNRASFAGGSIYRSEDDGEEKEGLSCQFISNRFVSNEADIGGGVVLDEVTIDKIIANEFVNNRARRGGGMFIAGSSIGDFNDLLFEKNRAFLSGGGLGVEGTSILSVKNVSIVDNRVEPESESEGQSDNPYLTPVGAGFSFYRSSISIFENFVFKRNIVRADFFGGEGGGLFLVNTAVGSIRNGLFINNFAHERGAGIFTDEQFDNDAYGSEYEYEYERENRSARLNESNQSYESSHNDEYEYEHEYESQDESIRTNNVTSIYEIINVTFMGNRAGFDGAGAYLRETYIKKMHDCTFSDNQASFGGAGLQLLLTTVDIIRDTLFTNNSVMGYGGAVGMWNANVIGNITTSLINCTFLNNSASHGAGMFIYESEIRTLTNSTFSKNTADFISNSQPRRRLNSLKYSRNLKKLEELSINLKRKVLLPVSEIINPVFPDMIRNLQNDNGSNETFFNAPLGEEQQNDSGSNEAFAIAPFGEGGLGSGLYLVGNIHEIKNCSFTNNAGSVLVVRGGDNFVSGLGILSNSLFENNTARVCAVAACLEKGNMSVVSQTVFRKNLLLNFEQNIEGSAGAMAIRRGDYSIKECIFENNNGTGGGAINIGIGSTSTIAECTFQNNEAFQGGAVLQANAISTVLSNSYFEENHAINDCNTTDGEFLYSATPVNVLAGSTNCGCKYGVGGSIYIGGGVMEIHATNFSNSRLPNVADDTYLVDTLTCDNESELLGPTLAEEVGGFKIASLSYKEGGGLHIFSTSAIVLTESFFETDSKENSNTTSVSPLFNLVTCPKDDNQRIQACDPLARCEQRTASVKCFCEGVLTGDPYTRCTKQLMTTPKFELVSMNETRAAQLRWENPKWLQEYISKNPLRKVSFLVQSSAFRDFDNESAIETYEEVFDNNLLVSLEERPYFFRVSAKIDNVISEYGIPTEVVIFCQEGNAAWSARTSSIFKYECEPCPLHQYKYDQRSCRDCPTRTQTVGIGTDTIEGCVPAVGFFNNTQTNLIESCPVGTLCMEPGSTLKNLPLAPGYWRSNSESLDIYTCPIMDFCVGSSSAADARLLSTENPEGHKSHMYCADFHMGPFCEVCTEGSARRGTSLDIPCTGCNAEEIESDGRSFAVRVSVLVILWLVFLFSLVFDSLFPGKIDVLIEKILSCVTLGSRCKEKEYNSKKRLKSTRELHLIFTSRFKIISGFWQVMSAYLGLLPNTGLEGDYSRMSILESVSDTISSIDVTKFLFMDTCYLAPNHYRRLLLVTIVPMICSISIYLTYLIVLLILKRRVGSVCGRLKLEGDIPGHNHAYVRFFQALLVFMFLVYPVSCRIIFQTFQCETIGSENYLEQDHSIKCDDSDERKFYKRYASVMIVLFPFGIPLWLFNLLWKKQTILKEVGTVPELNFLYKSYKGEYFYFEIVEMLRKLLQTSAIVFIAKRGTDLQTGISIEFAFLVALLLSGLKPYLYESDTRLAVMAQVFLSFAACATLAKPDTKSIVILFSLLITIMVLTSILTAEIFVDDNTTAAPEKHQIIQNSENLGDKNENESEIETSPEDGTDSEEVDNPIKSLDLT